MNFTDIQKLFDNVKAGQDIKLPPGEFEGPFVISRPCTVIGSPTTLWSLKGPVVSIQSKNVKLQDLNIEITSEKTLVKDYNCINSVADILCKNVSIVGDVNGIQGEGGEWNFPKFLHLGDFPSDRKISCYFDVYLPLPSVIVSNIKAVTLSPERLSFGFNRIKLEIDKTKQGNYIFGEIVLKSMFNRIIYFDGTPKEQLSEFGNGKVLYSLSSIKEITKKDDLINNSVSSKELSGQILLKKGERVEVKKIFENMKFLIKTNYLKKINEIEMDPYIFLLSQNNKVTDEKNLIFFGNPISSCKSIIITEESAEINLNLLPNKISKVILVYSIYGENQNHNFSKIKDLSLDFFYQGNLVKKFVTNDLFIEKTAVMLEIYKFKDQWKMTIVSSGYRNGLEFLCKTYGLDVQ